MTQSRLAGALSGAIDEAKARAALRDATRLGPRIRVFGWPRIACEGELVVGRSAVFVSTPAPITLVVAPGARIVIGEGALIESGATVRASGRVVIGNRARIGVGCILDDEGTAGMDITVNDGAWLEDGVVLLGGAVVAAQAFVRRERSSVEPPAGTETADAEMALLVGKRVRSVVSRVVSAAGSVDAGADLAHVKGWDSLAALRVLVALEKEFAVSLPTNLLANHPTLESITPWLVSRAAAGAEAR